MAASVTALEMKLNGGADTNVVCGDGTGNKAPLRGGNEICEQGIDGFDSKKIKISNLGRSRSRYPCF
jgi:hypothetical protein